MCSLILNTPSHLPSHPIPLGCPRALALGALLHASNLHWSSVLHMVIYMFQCYSLISSRLCLLPHSPKVCSLHLCLFCCLAYRVIITIFLNSIYQIRSVAQLCLTLCDPMNRSTPGLPVHHQLYTVLVFLFLAYFTLYNSFIHLIRTDSNAFFLKAE